MPQPLHQRSAAIGVVPKDAPPPRGVRTLKVLLVKPSKYDEEGYVIRYVRGVLPSNTLAALASLTEEASLRGDLGSVAVETLLLDDGVQRVDVDALARRYLRPHVRPVVALCGVQTNQFPRAADLARRFRAAGLPVMIGGFHVSGAIAMGDGVMPDECRSLMEAGITLVKGEVEGCWGDLLRDALHGALRSFYDIATKPDLSRASVPFVDPKLLKRYAYPFMGTIDAGRGCPYRCTFCTIINVQGHEMRHRDPEVILDRVRRNVAFGIDYYFFTDDNFARNPAWEAIFDGLIGLRREAGIDFQFMMQVDVLAYRIPGFVAKAAKAGCTQVFIGMETLNADNLAAAGKRQNRVQDYRAMIDAWHASGVACHVGYIIGFPHDTPDRVRDDVRRLREEVLVDQASFFILTPTPGSQDHLDRVRSGAWMDPDYNRFDSFQPVMAHPKMTHGEWLGAYRAAWRDFYSVEGMKSILSRANVRTYWGLFKNFCWYRYANLVEDTHPMICGFFRLKSRTDRRPGIAVEPRWRHAARRCRETLEWARRTRDLYFEMQEVWLATRGRARFQASLDGWKRRYGDARDRLGESTARAGQALGRRVATARSGAGDVWRRAAARLDPFAIRTPTRAHLNAYWKETYEKLRRGRIFQINPLMLGFNFLRDVKICTRFNLSMLAGYGK
ncbi:MAG: radical SAM protein [Acidobacteriia bacterium]|nr:radical SAM protein [Terriglobia bacterium]